MKWELTTRWFHEGKEARLQLALSSCLATVMRTARDNLDVQNWDIWLDAAHAPGELCFTGIANGCSYTIRQVST